jgi:SNF2 family DNA or RNA helicase
MDIIMQGIVFIYEEERSVKNKMFTLRIEERKKTGKIWVPAGPSGFYTARDLQKPGVNIIDKTLFSMAFKSETEIRKLEGRFYSLDQEYSLFRISPYDLKTFLDRCFCSEILCRKDGYPIHFNYVGNTIPEIEFKNSGNGFMAIVSLMGKKVDLGYEIISNPVRIVSGMNVYELAPGLPVTVVKNLMSGRIIPGDEYEEVLKALSQYAGSLNLKLPGKKKKITHGSLTPVLDIDKTFRFANLGFMYEGFGLFALGDNRKIFFNHKKNIELHRNFKEENTFRNRLEKYGAIYRKTTHGDWFIPEGKRDEILYKSKKDGFLIKLSGNPLILDINVVWDIKVKNQKLFVGGTVRHGEDNTEEKSDMGNILDAYLSRQRWFDIPGGFRGYIPKNLLRNFKQLEQRGDFKDEEILFEHNDFSFVAQVFHGEKNVFQDQTFGEYLSFLEEIDDPICQTESPKSLMAKLRPYQRVGFNWLAGLQRFGFGGVLADDMGLGKTVQVLTLLLFLKEKKVQPHLTLLIVPKTLIWNWESEIKKFSPSLNTKIHTGSGREKSFSDLSDVDLLITSYGLVRQDIDILSRVSWDLLVLDEAQAIKNPNAKISKSVKRLKSSNRLSLTGTPIENRPRDLWSLFDFLMPGFLGDEESFKKTYEQQNQESLNTLGILTAPFIMRRMKHQVCSELPTKTEITLFCDFTEEQKACYDEVLMAGKHQLSGKSDETQSTGSQSMQILTVLLRLRQTACHPALVPGTISYKGSSGKFELVLKTALEILKGGYKILIFSQFVAHLELVKKIFQQHGVEQHTLYGSTRQRKDVINRFKDSNNPCVFLISLKTGGVGLNLTEAGYVFLLDPWWNPAIENQAIDRSYRIGQENPVTVYRFITKNSVEENVSLLKERKKQIEKAVLQHGEFQDIKLSAKELLELI